MTDESGFAAVPDGPPWAVDVVADVHAGLYPAELNSQLRERMMADPAARDILAALGSVVDELSLLPTLTMPERYATRLSAALEAETRTRAPEFRGTVPARGARPAVLRTDLSPLLEAAPGWVAPADPSPPRAAGGPYPPIPAPRSVPDSGPGRPRPAGPEQTQRIDPDATRRIAAPTRAGSDPGRGGPPRFTAEPGPAYTSDPSTNVTSLDAARRRRRGRATGILGLAAAVAVIGVVTIVAIRPGHGPDQAGGSGLPAPATLTTPPSGAGLDAQFTVDPNDLAGAYSKVTGHWTAVDTIVFNQCIVANQLGDKVLLGSSRVTYQGSPAIALAFALDQTRALLLLVGPDCGRSGPEPLASQTISR